MHEHSAEMLRCLRECDVSGARKLWHHLAPMAPAPRTDGEALAVLHHARTLCRRLGVKDRAYSHRWLLDHDLPSGLPDRLKPKAERLYPRIVGGYGISVQSSVPEVGRFIEGAMVGGVLDCYAEGRTEKDYVVPVMMERRAMARKKLHGILSEAAARAWRRGEHG